jgi:hypothetical protein
MFNDDSPISVRFNQTFYGLTNVQGGVRTVSPAIGAPAGQAVVQLLPGLLKRGDEWSFSAVLTGPVEVTISAPLIDTDVAQVVPESEVDSTDITVSLSVWPFRAELPLPSRRLTRR